MSILDKNNKYEVARIGDFASGITWRAIDEPFCANIQAVRQQWDYIRLAIETWPIKWLADCDELAKNAVPIVRSQLTGISHSRIQQTVSLHWTDDVNHTTVERCRLILHFDDKLKWEAIEKIVNHGRERKHQYPEITRTYQGQS